MGNWIFGYGSLINRSSIIRTLKRDLQHDDIIPVDISGFERGWFLKEIVYSEKLEKKLDVAFLDLKKSELGSVNGVIFKVNDAEFQNFLFREKNYDCVEIEPAQMKISLNETFTGKIFTFISKPEFRVKDSDGEIVVMQRYIDMVENGCKNWGPDFLIRYTHTTHKVTFPIVEGKYVFLDPKQANNV